MTSQNNNEEVTIVSEEAYKPAFVTANGKGMYYPPQTVVGSSDAFYVVQASGQWVKFAELRKGKWKLLRFTQEMLDTVLEEVEKIRVAQEAQKAVAETLEQSKAEVAAEPVAEVVAA
jgi:hypothetical protein